MRVWVANILILLSFIVLTAYAPVELTEVILTYGNMYGGVDSMMAAELNIIWFGYTVAMLCVAMMIYRINRRR